MKKIQALLICGMVFLFAGCGKTDYTKVEKELTKDAKAYYEKNLEGKVTGVNSHKITLAALKASGVSIKNFTALDCKTTSYALVNLTLDADKKVTKTEIVNYLTCGDYTTSNK